MIKKGENFCPTCGKVSKEKDSIWLDAKNQIAFKLTREGFSYRVKSSNLYNNGSLEVNNIDISVESRTNGCPKIITATYYNNKNEVEGSSLLKSSARLCPCCFRNGNSKGQITHLLPDMGFYPSYFVALVGIPETGKTVYKNAITRQETFFTSSYTEVRSLDRETDEAVLSNGFVTAPKPTTLGNGEYDNVCFSIVNNNKTLAKVYLIDTAGEYLRKERHEDDAATKTQFLISKHADALMVMYDPRFIASPDLVQYQDGREKKSGSVSIVLNDTSDRILPGVVVMTGADRLKTIANIKKGIHDRSGNIVIGSNSCLFTNTETINKNVLCRHSALAKDVLNSFDIRTHFGKNTGYFLVSSGKDATLNGQAAFCYEQATNVRLPLVWLLNQLGIVNV